MADLNKMLEEIKGLSVLELNELVKMIENEFGVSAAAMAVAAPAAPGSAPGEWGLGASQALGKPADLPSGWKGLAVIPKSWNGESLREFGTEKV